MMFFLLHIFITWYMCPFDVATLLGRYLVTSWIESTSHDRKYTFWISLIHVYLTGLNASTCRYLNKSVWFLMFYVILILCYTSLSSFWLLFYKVTLHNPVVLSLVIYRIFHPRRFRNLCVWIIPLTLHNTSFWCRSKNYVSLLLGYVLLLMFWVIEEIPIHIR